MSSIDSMEFRSPHLLQAPLINGVLDDDFQDTAADSEGDSEVSTMTQEYDDGTVVIFEYVDDADGVDDEDGADIDVVSVTVIEPDGESVKFERDGAPLAGGGSVWTVISDTRTATASNTGVAGQKVSSPNDLLQSTPIDFEAGFELGTQDTVSMPALEGRTPTAITSTNAMGVDTAEDGSVITDLYFTSDSAEDDVEVVGVRELSADEAAEMREDAPEIPDEGVRFFEYTMSDGTTQIVMVNEADLEGVTTPEGAPATASWAADTFMKTFVTLPPESRSAMSGMPVMIGDPSADDATEEATDVSSDGVMYIAPSLVSYQDESPEGVQLLFFAIMSEIGSSIFQNDEADEGDLGERWDDAVVADGESVSADGDSDPETDFSETFVLWVAVRTGMISGAEAEALEERYANRFAVLDQTPAATAALPIGTELPGADREVPTATTTVTQTYADGTVVTMVTAKDADGIVDADGADIDIISMTTTRADGSVTTIERDPPSDDGSPATWTITENTPGSAGLAFLPIGASVETPASVFPDINMTDPETTPVLSASGIPEIEVERTPLEE